MMPRSLCENRSRPSFHTLFEAIALVVLVVILFCKPGRASIIPLIAVPCQSYGTFAVLYLLGFSINTLSLFAWCSRSVSSSMTRSVVVEKCRAQQSRKVARRLRRAPGDD